MSFSAADVDAIVREVMRRLAEADGPTPGASGDTLRLDVKVVSMAAVEGRLAGIAILAVPRRAIITPLVRDYLKDNNVTLHRHTA